MSFRVDCRGQNKQGKKIGEMHHTNICQTVCKEQFAGVATNAKQEDDLNTTFT